MEAVFGKQTLIWGRTGGKHGCGDIRVVEILSFYGHRLNALIHKVHVRPKICPLDTRLDRNVDNSGSGQFRSHQFGEGFEILNDLERDLILQLA